MRDKYPLSMVSFIRSITGPLKVCRKDIKALGREQAYELFMARSQGWTFGHMDGRASSAEEAIAVAAFAAALSFINVLWVTGEIDHDAK